MADIPTKDRILDAAEELFAEQGFATSLRAITATADANLAAVNYHFGSKDALVEAVFERRLGPLNRTRLELLDALEGGDHAPPLEALVEAFVGPALRMSDDPQGARFMRLFGHALGQRDDRILRLLTGQFEVIRQRFSAAFAGALPHLDATEVIWRMIFTVGAMAHTMALSDKLPALTRGACDALDVEETVRRLVPFIAGGLRADAATVGGEA